MAGPVSRREAALEKWLLVFLLFSGAGWVWEVALTALTQGRWVNRGMLRGPWLPVYGVGGAALCALLVRLRRRWAAPLVGALAGGLLEYGTALALELLFRQRWWDYTGWAGSIQGRVCLASLAGFALAGWMLMRLAPRVLERVERMPPGLRTALCRGVCLAFALDWSFSLLRPNMGAGITCPLGP